MHILHTVLCTYPTVLTKRICLTIKNFSGWWSFPVFLWPYCVIEGRFHRENLVASLYSRDCNYGSKCFTVITSATTIVNVITLPFHFPFPSKSLPSIYHNFSFGDLVSRHILSISYQIFFFLLITWFTMYISNAKSFIFFLLNKGNIYNKMYKHC